MGAPKGFPLALWKPSGTNPVGRQAQTRAVVGASIPQKENFFRQSWLPPLLAGGFPLAPCTPSGSPIETNKRPYRTASPNPRRSRRVNPPAEISYNKVGVYRCLQGAFLGANHRRGPHAVHAAPMVPPPCSYSTVTLFARFLGLSTSQPR